MSPRAQAAAELPPLPTVGKPPVQVTPKAGSRLAQLHALYLEKRAAYEAADEEFDAVKTAIKAELATAAPNQVKVDLVSGAGPGLRLNYVESWRVDSRALKSAHPEIWQRVAKKSGSWRLDPIKQGAGS